MNYAQAMRRIAEDYAARKRDYLAAEAELFAADPAFADVERALRDMTLRKAKGEQIDEQARLAYKQKDEQIRRAHGLLPPSPRCDKCGDTGKVNGKYCECVIRLALQSQAEEIRIPAHEFSDVDYSVYGEQADAYRKIFGDIETICARHPFGKKKTVVLSGLTGTGKTYLAGCAVQSMLGRGQSVMALSAFASNDRFRRYHTCFDDSRDEALSPMLDCTLLVIDDLGTESILRNVTVEYLYLVLNEREMGGKLTIVTTNLTPDGILSRYGERIYSRLYDKSLSYATFLKGKDLRSFK